MTNEMCPRRPKKTYPLGLIRSCRQVSMTNNFSSHYLHLFTCLPCFCTVCQHLWNREMAVLYLKSIAQILTDLVYKYYPRKHIEIMGFMALVWFFALVNLHMHNIASFILTYFKHSSQRHFQSGRALFLLVEFSRIPCDFRQ